MEQVQTTSQARPVPPSTMESKPIKFMISQPPYERSFFVHKELIQKHSRIPDFFEVDPGSTQAFGAEEDITRDEKGNLYLKSDNPDAFALLVRFLYSNFVTIDAGNISLITPLYLLCEKLGLNIAMNRIMDELQAYDCENFDRFYTVQEIKDVYDHCNEDSKLWAYAVAGVACRSIRRALDKAFRDQFMDYIMENPSIGSEYFAMSGYAGRKIVKYNADYRKPTVSHEFRLCMFHVHPEGVS